MSPQSENHVTIQGIDLRLPDPFQGNIECFGLLLSRRQLAAAWFSEGPHDPPMSPRIVGLPGVGKTTVALSVAKERNQEVYVMQATSDLRPEDLIVQPVLRSGQELEYVASPLLAAMIRGGVCVLDEGNRMSEKCWAALAPLLDNRRYVESVLTGLRIPAHEDFRFATTMNDDSSTYELPDYITSRLMPKIELEHLDEDEMMDTLQAAVPYAEVVQLENLIAALKDLDTQGFDSSVRDGVQIARYISKRLGLSSRNPASHSFPETKDAVGETLTPQKLLLEAIALTVGSEAASILEARSKIPSRSNLRPIHDE